MILHLVHDEKIINRTMKIFEEVAPSQNVFVVFTRHNLKHVEQQQNVVLFKDFYKKYKNVTFSSIVIHFLNSRKIRFINKYITYNTSIFWIIWGNDIYNKLLYTNGFELYDTKSSYHLENKKNSIFTFFEKIVEKIKVFKMIKFISKRINYIATDASKVDYTILLDYFPKLKTIEHVEFFYYSIESVLSKELLQSWVYGDNIQIGNSASITNNHEYVMRYLSHLKLNDKNVIVPLSYSGTDAYKKSVKTKGKEYFGNNFKALENFMPLNEYNNLMLSFTFAFYGNFRQEAIGNILISLYLGTKVFIPKKSPMITWAKNLDLIVFELETITQFDIDDPLDLESRIHNRNTIKSIFSQERLYKLINDNFIN